MIKKLYVIHREDFFTALAQRQIPEDSIFQVGSVWVIVFLTQTERENYKFPIKEC